LVVGQLISETNRPGKLRDCLTRCAKFKRSKRGGGSAFQDGFPVAGCLRMVGQER
jgi:hypothetical protein